MKDNVSIILTAGGIVFRGLHSSQIRVIGECYAISQDSVYIKEPGDAFVPCSPVFVEPIVRDMVSSFNKHSQTALNADVLLVLDLDLLSGRLEEL